MEQIANEKMLVCPRRWNTPLEEDGEGAEEHRATWGQAGGDEGGYGAGPSNGAGPSRKRGAEEALDDGEELPEEVKQRLAALQG